MIKIITLISFLMLNFTAKAINPEVDECIKTCDATIDSFKVLVKEQQNQINFLENSVDTLEKENQKNNSWYNDKTLWLTLGILTGALIKR